MKIKLQVFVLGLLLPVSAWPATWFVRPGVQSSWNQTAPAHPIPTPGVYGAQNGTNWANAWNGLESIVWGPGGVQPGDTLYVCGTHIYSLMQPNYGYSQAVIVIGTSGCTIRMDYPSDPGTIFGGAFDRIDSTYSTWYGPDSNGVYWNAQSSRWTQSYQCPYWEVHGTNLTRLNTTNVTTWAGGLGAWASIGGTNYIKTTSGNAPGTNIAMNTFGWTLVLPVGVSNVTFQSCAFIGGGLALDVPNYDTSGNPPLNCAANHITLRNCRFLDCCADQFGTAKMLSPQPGNDYWTFDGCEIGYGPSAIYSGCGPNNSQHRGVIGTVITNCYIHDLDTVNYPAVDGHAIGAQDNSNCVFVGNRIERTGCAIALFSFGYVMTNNLVGWNFIKNVHWHSQGGNTGGEGIWLSAQTNVAPGNRIIGNIVLNTGLPGPGPYASWMGSGISSSAPNHVDIVNNVVMNSAVGINVAVTSFPPDATIENNIIVAATNNLIHVSGTTAGTVTCDYNLFYTNIAVAVPFVIGVTHDTHSKWGNPLFVSRTPLSTQDFRLSEASPAIRGGVAIGVPHDFNGAPIPTNTPPDIGAFQFLTGQFSGPSGVHATGP